LKPKKQNLKLRDRESRLSMMLLLRLRLRPIDLPLWLLMKLTRLLKLLEEQKKRNKLLPIRDRWPLVDLHLRKPSEMCGLLEIPVFHLSI